MSDRVLNKYLNRKEEGIVDAAVVESGPDGTEDLGAFGWLRGQRDRAVMLELRRKTGEVLAIGYSWIEKMEFSPSGAIALYCGRLTIRIKGRNLNGESRPQTRLFQGLTRHRVPWIQEADHAADLRADQKAVVVESIEW